MSRNYSPISSRSSVYDVDENEHHSRIEDTFSDSDSSSTSRDSKITGSGRSIASSLSPKRSSGTPLLEPDHDNDSSARSKKKSDSNPKSSGRSKIEFDDNSKSSIRSKTKSDISSKSSSRSKIEPDLDSEPSSMSQLEADLNSEPDFMSQVNPDDSSKFGYKSRKESFKRSKICPKKGTCCSVCLLICKITTIVAIFLVLSLIGVGYFLTKLEFDCKVKELGPKLHSGIYGQDVAIKRTLEYVSTFCTGLASNDPLTLVFWGPTGVGKTFFATIFTDHFDSKGHVVPSEHFKAAKYKDWYGNHDHNKPFVYAVDDVTTLEDIQDIATNVEKLSFPLILIITTSMESHLLNQSFIDWCAGGKAETDYLYTGPDPRWLTELQHLNPVVVPFLPLSRTNVKLCVEKTLKTLKMKYSKDDIERIANEFEYFSNDKRLFSKIGCKRVNDKIFSVLSP